ncbi:MAG: hypothetical protein H0V56_12700 [Chthoniobacterales bacterium]|nr:hypothetical protein [Chthoniobacterales bacterium]
MRKLLLLPASTLLLLCSLAALPAAAAPKTESDIFGYFSIAGKAPAGFQDIDVILLGGSGEYGAQAKPPFHGLIRMKNKKAKDYQILAPARKGKAFSFRTAAVASISYEFEGTLRRTEFNPENPPQHDEVVLTGTLRKMKAGEPIAGAKVDFTWELGD